MKKKYIFISLLAILMFCILINVILIGCTNKNSIVGKWRDGSGNEIEFYKDGTVVFLDSFGGVAGEYSFPDGSHIRFLHAANIYGEVCEIKINGNELTLSSNDTTYLLIRVKN